MLRRLLLPLLLLTAACEEEPLRDPFVQVADPGPWTAVAVGGEQSCGLKTDQSLWCWGDYGVVRGNTAYRTKPVRVDAPARWSQISLGNGMGCGVSDDARLYCWGNLPVPGGSEFAGAPKPEDFPEPVSAVSVGEGHWCVVTTANGVFCRGRIWMNGSRADALAPEPAFVRALAVASGRGFACAIDLERQMQCWSSGDVYGDGATIVTSAVRGWSSAGAGREFICAVDLDRKLWCWGATPFHYDDLYSQHFETLPEKIDDADWLHFAGGWQHACGIRADGGLYCWGMNTDGQLAFGWGGTEDAFVSEPRKVGSAQWAQVAVGFSHTCALKSDATIWCAGQNSEGQLGIGVTDEGEYPDGGGGGGWDD